MRKDLLRDSMSGCLQVCEDLRKRSAHGPVWALHRESQQDREVFAECIKGGGVCVGRRLKERHKGALNHLRLCRTVGALGPVEVVEQTLDIIVVKFHALLRESKRAERKDGSSNFV